MIVVYALVFLVEMFATAMALLMAFAMPAAPLWFRIAASVTALMCFAVGMTSLDKARRSSNQGGS